MYFGTVFHNSSRAQPFSPACMVLSPIEGLFTFARHRQTVTMTMIAKMLKRKVSRVTTEAPDLNAVAGSPGSGGDPTQQTQAPDAASHRGHRDSEGLQRAASVSLPLQYRQVFVAMISISNEERSKTLRRQPDSRISPSVGCFFP